MQDKITIIGAGISGLSLAYHLEAMKRPYTLYEAKTAPGGLCASYRQEGFTFDYGGHLLHLATPQGLKLAQKLLGKNALVHKRAAYAHTYGVDLPYPFQYNLYGLPEAIVSECVKGALEAYKEKPKPATTFKQWALSRYGAGICKHFMFPYNAKLWQTDLGELTPAWCAQFIPPPKLEDIIKGAYARRRKDFGYNATFLYPKTGGCNALIEGLLKKVKNLTLNASVERVDLQAKTITIHGREQKYQKLVTTAPLADFGKLIKNLPADVKKSFAALRSSSVYVLNLGVSGPTKAGHWYYFAEDKYPFYRVGVQSNFAPANAPAGSSSFYVEFAQKPGKKPDFKKWEEQALKQLFELGFISQEGKILAASWVEIPCAYAIYDKAYEAARQNIFSFLRSHDIYPLGRYGAWEYSFMEKSLLDGAAMAIELVKI